MTARPPTFHPSSSRRGGTLRLLWPVLAVLLVLGGAWFWQAHRFPQEGSPAVRFARDMRLHHGQAVELSLHILERPVSAPVRLLAQDITVTQEAQLGQMGGWLDIWGLPFSGPDAPMQGMNRAAMGMASDADVQSLDTLPARQAEIRYLQLMLRHHRGGVQMAQEGLKSGVPPVVTVANAIVVSQTAEIDLITGMLRERGAAVPPANGTVAPGSTDGMNGMPMNH
ncbi:DUF305 domain-containing protein [Deinococcus aquiradiocola]|uniref:DUF305 domain-containing protein n=1 Tax=Deinococcus aquiradiocola TaxID=393059 RepID=A0A917UVQ8_9DEIO|nr:DUF305 domain-containing protein [Deinococcus aquiradiocola]GGJ88221.1 DUF305 domain-containing protein [Deinococcus aquiradiocola]